MLKPVNRLTKDRDFNLVLKHGQWINGRLLSIKALDLAKNQNFFPKKEGADKFKKQLKLAFVVGLKVSKSAVVRNRAKRQMREVARLLLKDKVVTPGWYLMVVAKPEILTADYASISQEIGVLFKRLGLI